VQFRGLQSSVPIYQCNNDKFMHIVMVHLRLSRFNTTVCDNDALAGSCCDRKIDCTLSVSSRWSAYLMAVFHMSVSSFISHLTWTRDSVPLCLLKDLSSLTLFVTNFTGSAVIDSLCSLLSKVFSTLPASSFFSITMIYDLHQSVGKIWKIH